jgi:YD repeat-containing protein
MSTPNNGSLMKPGYFILVLAFLLVPVFSLHAAIETDVNRISGSAVVASGTVSAIDNKYSYMVANSSGTPPLWQQNLFGIQRGVGRVRLGVNHQSLSYISTPYTATVVVSLTYYTSANPNTAVPFGSNQTLVVSYDPAGAATQTDRSTFELNSANLPAGTHIIRVQASVVSVSVINTITLATLTTPSTLFLEAETEVERYYKLDLASIPAAGTLRAPTTPNSANELALNWDAIQGAEEYELEWTWVNDYAANGAAMSAGVADAQLLLDFKNNSTRVTVTGNTFNIPLLFDQGYLAFRVRAAGYALDATDSKWKRVTGRWTGENTTNYLLGNYRTATAYTGGGSHVFYINNTLAHRIKLNWQYNAVYAEEGKKKEVVSYYDGSLRNRQTVTKTSTDKKVLVGETIYDHEGRGAVTVLPFPVAGNNLPIDYRLGLNVNASTVSYSRNDFDLDAPNCTTTVTASLRTSSGASNYYSASNPEQSGAQAFLPNAGGYPMVQVEYTPDNTGRVRRQGGVGANHQLGSGHETRYFYGQPQQEELDRLFGSDVGFKKHYNKVVTVDANGQSSVSYVDQEGRTIATGLAGNNTDPFTGAALPLDPLRELGSGVTSHSANQQNNFQVDLLGKINDADVNTDNDDNQLTVNGDALEVTTQLLVTSASTYSFTYTLDGVAFSPECLSNVCYNCVYDLEINITDACGAPLSSASPQFPVSAMVGTINQGCAPGDLAKFQFTPGAVSLSLQPGNYTVTKRLKINQAAMEAYLADYLTRSECVQQQADMIAAALAAVDVSSCESACPECDDYQSPCRNSYQMMLSDVSPHGQYAGLRDQTGAVNTGYHPLSVLNTSNSLPKLSANWRNPKFEANNDANYYMADGTTKVLIPVQLIGNTYIPAINNASNLKDASGNTWTSGDMFIQPQNLATVEDFVFYWQASWARSLVTFHPEYCYYEWCKTNTEIQSGSTQSSDQYDETLLSTTTRAAAVASSPSLLNPLSTTQAGCNDPYFRTGGRGAAQYTAMNAAMQNYNGSGVTIWQMARIIGTPAGNMFNATVSALLNEADNGISPAPGNTNVDWIYTDQDWENFKMLYLSLKQQFMQTASDASAMSCQGYNGCIGTTTFDPQAAGMIGSPILSSPFFDNTPASGDPAQPCSNLSYLLYAGKVKRFVGTNDALNLFASGNYNSANISAIADQNYYMLTGQCPNARDLQSLLSKLAQNNQLKASALNLTSYPEFTPDLYQSMVPANVATTVSYTGTGSGATLTMAFSGTNVTCTSPTLAFGSSSSFSWSNYNTSFRITGFRNLLTNGSGGYTVTALIDHDMNTSTPEVEEVMSGTQGCFELTCTLPTVCTPSTVVQDVITLLNLLSANNQLVGTPPVSGVSMSNAAYSTFFTNSNLPALLPCSTTYYWQQHPSLLTYGLNCSNSWVPSWTSVDFSPALSSLTGTIQSFTYLNMVSATQVSVRVTTSTGTTTVTLSLGSRTDGSAPTAITLGNCGSPVPQQCEGAEYQRRVDLENLLNAKRTTLTTDQGLGNVPAFTSLLEHAGAGSYTWDAGTVSGNTLAINIYKGSQNCNLTLTFAQNPSAGNGFTTITRFGPLVADETNLINGQAFHFSIVAWFSDNTSTLINGTSCYAIRNCPVCTSATTSTYQNFDQVNTASPGYTTSLTYVSGCPANGQYTLTNKAATTCSSTTLTGSDHTNPASGKYVYAQVAASSNLTVWSKTVNVSAYTPYTFSAWYSSPQTTAYTVGSTATVQLLVNSNVVASATVLEQPGIWKQLTAQWNGTVSTTATVELRVSTNATSAWKLAFDDVAFFTPGCAPAPVYQPGITWPYTSPCASNLNNIATLNAQNQYQQYMAQVSADFRKDYIARCIGSAVETFKTSYNFTEYQFTLYYYDQGANLVRTVPPQGVKIVNLAGDANSANGPDGAEIKSNRLARLNNPAAPKTFETSHRFTTTYTYNSLNQLVKQSTPDGGETRFWYDRLGRIIASQNAKQAAQSPQRWSYTVYDALGRISEVGELNTNSDLKTMTAPALASLLNNTTFPDNWAGTAATNNRTDVTRTYYDVAQVGFGVNARFSNGQKNLRKRVAHAAVYDVYTGNITGYSSASHYSYDIHGNVDELVQEIPELGVLDHAAQNMYQRYKNLKYSYDLVSGNVKEVLYQQGQPDQFYHKYEYDADNRIVNMFTSSDRRHWDRDAKYFYYQHGPLARTELGEQKVQGLDYAYTIQGWIKGVNSNSLNASRDMGRDGAVATGNPNQYVAGDQMGYSLSYFNGDYSSIGTSSFIASIAGSGLNGASPNLWNGNIRHMVVSIKRFMSDVSPVIRPQAFAYKYDQLNRIVSAQVDTAFNYGTNSWDATTPTAQKYKESFTYDHNGNIIRQNRNGNNTQLNLDQLKYFYYNAAGGTYDPEVSTPNNATNRLAYVTDAVSTPLISDDLESQSANNYTYDQIGQLTGDAQEQIGAIVWTVYNKIRSVTRTAGSTKTDLEFKYDAMGQRMVKIAKPRTGGSASTQDAWVYTYYVRDAQGNVMATYERTLPRNSGTYKDIIKLREQHLYGSSRAGMRQVDLILSSKDYTFNTYNGLLLSGTFQTQTSNPASQTSFVRMVGQKVYEMANHLGNVLVTVTDGRLVLNSGAAVTGYTAVVRSAMDYSAFGAPLAGRTFSSNAYRYSMNGQEKDEELGAGVTTAEFWQYDAKLARRWNVDPVVKPWQSGYSAFDNCPVVIIDPNGDDGENSNEQEPASSSSPDLVEGGTPLAGTNSTNWGQFNANNQDPSAPSAEYIDGTRDETVARQSFVYSQQSLYTSTPGERVFTTLDNVQPGSTLTVSTFTDPDIVTIRDAQTGAILGSPTTGQVGSEVVFITIPANTTSVIVESTPQGPRANESVFTVDYVQSATLVFMQVDEINDRGQVVKSRVNWFSPEQSQNMLQRTPNPNSTIPPIVPMGNATPTLASGIQPPPTGIIAPAGLYQTYLNNGGVSPDLQNIPHSGVRF